MKLLFLKSGGWERAGGVGVCLGSDLFVTPEEFGYSRGQSTQCSQAAGTSWCCAVTLNLLLLGEDGF